MKVVNVVGARPQFIKAATVSRALKPLGDVQEMLIHTGQHFDENMSDIFFRELELRTPDHHLGINSSSHGVMTGRMLERLEAVLQEIRPDWVVVYGDTNSTLAGALAAAKLHIPVAHVEAGLRSFNRKMPEEINRVLTDHAANLLFTPTDTATRNLLGEGIKGPAIKQVGDVMYDAALFSSTKADETSEILDSLQLERQTYVLVTVHRQENTDEPARLNSIFNALQIISQERPVVIPLHPRTRKALAAYGLEHVLEDLIVCPPLGYLDMAMLVKHASVLATDSGGLQKEAYFQSVPCVTLRDETEWTELVDLGWNFLASPSGPDIDRQIMAAIGQRGQAGSPYGNGDAAEKICGYLYGG